MSALSDHVDTPFDRRESRQPQRPAFVRVPVKVSDPLINLTLHDVFVLILKSRGLKLWITSQREAKKKRTS